MRMSAKMSMRMSAKMSMRMRVCFNRRLGCRPLALLLVVGLVMGCGRIHRGGQKKDEAGANPSAGGVSLKEAPYGLRVVAAASESGEQKDRPGEGEYLDSRSQGGYGSVELKEGRIVFRKRIPVFGNWAGKREAFLAWGGGESSRVTQSAQVDHRILTPDTDIERPGSAVSPSFHPESGRWFIPLRSLLTGGPGEANPQDVHILNVEQILEGGSRLLFQVRLRLDAGVPLVRPEAVPASGSPQPGGAAWLQQISASGGPGWAVRSELYSNPSDRPLTLWVRSRESWLELDSAIRYGWDWSPLRYRALRPAPAEWDETAYLARARFQLSSIRVEEGGRTREQALTEGVWVRIPLPPRASLRIEWVARQVQVPFPCRIRSGGTRRVCLHLLEKAEGTYWTADPGCAYLGSSLNRLEETVPERSRIDALRYSGSLGREAELTEDEERPEGAASPGSLSPQAGSPLLPDGGSERVRGVFNEMPSGTLASDGCSGISL